MKFITEQDLRYLYKSRPFTSYNTEPGTRLTPGARQFLSDRGVSFDLGEGFPQRADENKGEGPPGRKQPGGSQPDSRACQQGSDAFQTDAGPGKNLLIARLKSIEALFLTVGAELLTRDVVLSQDVMKLHSQLSGIRNSLTGSPPVKDLEPKECSGMCREDYSKELEDCFEITEFHMQTPKGAEIVALHRLRCALRELNAWMEVWYPGPEPEEICGMCREIKVKTNQIVNELSFMICLAFGGKTCQRKP